ncbi:TIM44-like domain-containing protein [Pseudomonas sp. F1_0610]|uniref:Tim44 domain-containing protein n=1 Tax=Pseudomonas sp. F1_0610 TaxID=3114284 RepID=UPI0039C3B3B9
MQRFLSIALALFIGLSFSFDADARRMGGGKSFGTAPKHSQAQQQRQQQHQAAPNTPAGKKPGMLGGMGGMLAGLAMGGLLASLFMGGGFEGLKLLDILIFAAIAFFAFRFFMARKKAQAQPATGPISNTYARQAQPQSIFGASQATPVAPTIDAPSWFNETSFLENARKHFMALQQHWDANEMDKIADFVTPEMLSFLKRERTDLGDGFQSTYIDQLEVYLDAVETLDDMTVASVTFTGIEKTSRFDQGENFNESWRLERVHGDNQPWLIAGIRQNP